MIWRAGTALRDRGGRAGRDERLQGQPSWHRLGAVSPSDDAGAVDLLLCQRDLLEPADRARDAPRFVPYRGALRGRQVSIVRRVPGRRCAPAIICEGGFTNNFGQVLSGTCDHRPGFDDLHQVAPLASVQTVRPPVIQDQ